MAAASGTLIHSDDLETPTHTEQSVGPSDELVEVRIQIWIDETLQRSDDMKVDKILVRAAAPDLVKEVLESAANNATTVSELIEAILSSHPKFAERGVFGVIMIQIDPGQRPGTTNLIVDVTGNKFGSFDELDWYTDPKDMSFHLGFAFISCNFFDFGEFSKAICVYGPYRKELSFGVFHTDSQLFKIRVTLMDQDWNSLCSYYDRTRRVSFYLFSTRHHDLVYNIGWRKMIDHSRTASESIRRQLGGSLLSSLKYTFTLNSKNYSDVAPTRGCSFVASSHIGGLAPDDWSARFLRQELKFRCAVPFEFATLNMGVAGGVIFPWGKGFLNKHTSLPERFFLGGDCAPHPALWDTSTVWGFKNRGISPAELKKCLVYDQTKENNFIGGDLAVSAFAYLSFQLPFRWLREYGVHGHAFASTGNVTKLAENEFRNFSFQGFVKSFRASVGAGIVIPIYKKFQLQLNYNYIVKQSKHDGGKAGFQICFTKPSYVDFWTGFA